MSEWHTLENGTDLLEGEETAQLGGVVVGGQTAQPGAVQGRVDGALDGARPLGVVPGCVRDGLCYGFEIVEKSGCRLLVVRVLGCHLVELGKDGDLVLDGGLDLGHEGWVWGRVSMASTSVGFPLPESVRYGWIG